MISEKTANQQGVSRPALGQARGDRPVQRKKREGFAFEEKLQLLHTASVQIQQSTAQSMPTTYASSRYFQPYEAGIDGSLSF